MIRACEFALVKEARFYIEPEASIFGFPLVFRRSSASTLCHSPMMAHLLENECVAILRSDGLTGS